MLMQKKKVENGQHSPLFLDNKLLTAEQFPSLIKAKV